MACTAGTVEVLLRCRTSSSGLGGEVQPLSVRRRPSLYPNGVAAGARSVSLWLARRRRAWEVWSQRVLRGAQKSPGVVLASIPDCSQLLPDFIVSFNGRPKYGGTADVSHDINVGPFS